MTSSLPRKTVFVVESQPITAEGVQTVLSGSAEFDFRGSASSLTAAADLLRSRPPELVLMDKAFGSQPLVEWITNARLEGLTSQMVVWGNSITEPEALRFLQAGVKGILRKTATAETLLTCLHAVAGGSNWMEETLFRDSARIDRTSRSELTPREQQVLELVEQGCKNKEIARELGIRPGTVKIHLKHIFEKTGVRGRYGLALTGLRHKGILEMSPV
jgi:two-component system nitrate/nitrite response regulator NarL